MVNRYKVTIEDEVYQVSVESIEEDTPSARPIAPSARTGAPAPRPSQRLPPRVRLPNLQSPQGAGKQSWHRFLGICGR